MVGPDPPAGLVVVRIAADGVTVHSGPPRPVVAGCRCRSTWSSTPRRPEVAVVVAGEAFTVAAGGAGVATVDVDAAAAASR